MTLAKQGPLRLRPQNTGIPKLQGVFRLKDEQGFPIDMAYEMAKEKGWCVDWIEALADALRQSISKFDSLIEEIGMLDPQAFAPVKRIFGMMLLRCDGATATEKAATLYSKLHEP